MENFQEIIKKIETLTLKIETKYPELYRFLEENPITIPSKTHSDTDIKAMQDYLESLKQLFKHHLETH